MTKKIKLLASSFMIALGLAAPHHLHAMEVESMDVEPQIISTDTLPVEVWNLILENTVALKIKDNEHPHRFFAFVCPEWRKMIAEGIKGNQNWFAFEKPCWKAWHGVLGHENTYNIIKKMSVIYRPYLYSDEGMIKLTIPSGVNPLDFTFDLSDKDLFHYAGNCLSISVGYPKGVNPEIINKVQVWIAPKFLIKQCLATSAKHFEPIMNKNKWNEDLAPVGIIFTLGWRNDIGDYAYLTNKDFGLISNNDCLELYRRSTPQLHTSITSHHAYHPILIEGANGMITISFLF